MISCLRDSVHSCEEKIVNLNGWATIHIAFEALWIADLGKIRKCPFNTTTGKFSINDRHCTEFHDFKKLVYTNIGASSKYLYVRLDSETEPNQIWRCDPNKQESCSNAFNLDYYFQYSNVGAFVFV